MMVNLNTPGEAGGEVEIDLNNRLASHAKNNVPKVFRRKIL
jgi:hypothetical protein